jgi:hypothetical protein
MDEDDFEYAVVMRQNRSTSPISDRFLLLSNFLPT